LYDEDHPEQHTLLLMDWQKDPALKDPILPGLKEKVIS